MNNNVDNQIDDTVPQNACFASVSKITQLPSTPQMQLPIFLSIGYSKCWLNRTYICAYKKTLHCQGNVQVLQYLITVGIYSKYVVITVTKSTKVTVATSAKNNWASFPAMEIIYVDIVTVYVYNMVEAVHVLDISFSIAWLIYGC